MSAPVIVGEFEYADIEWEVVYWPDEDEFDVVRADLPYIWRKIASRELYS